MNVAGYTNYINKYCGSIQFNDVWTSSRDNCKRYFSEYTFMDTVIKTRDGTFICMPISSEEISCHKENTDECYVRYYYERYKDRFSQCDIEEGVRGTSSTVQWFEYNIKDLLLKTKRAEFFEKTLKKNLEEYKTDLSEFNEEKVEPYLKKLNDIYTNYISLLDDIDNLLSYFDGNIEDKVYILKYLDCGNVL
jgi:hypothetical protein